MLPLTTAQSISFAFFGAENRALVRLFGKLVGMGGGGGPGGPTFSTAGDTAIRFVLAGMKRSLSTAWDYTRRRSHHEKTWHPYVLQVTKRESECVGHPSSSPTLVK